MEHSKIEWTDNTFNPWHGCTNIPGKDGAPSACDNCYAEAGNARNLHGWGLLWGHNAPRHILSDTYWKQPLAWNRQADRDGVQKRVFCGSMCDVMERLGDGRKDLDEPRQRLFELIEETPNLIWMMLTKRPNEYRHFLPKAWLKEPRPNVWLMATVEHKNNLWRIDEIVKVPAVVHGLSMEPLFSPIVLPASFLKLGTSGWVISGGESGRGQLRPTPAAWFRDLRDTCNGAHVPFFFKQWGEHQNLVKLGKKEAGRELDGRTWDEFPTPDERYFIERKGAA